VRKSMGEKLFRNSMVGGYRKEDVDDYIERLEKEVIRLQKRVNRQKADPSGQGEEERETAADMEEGIFLFENSRDPGLKREKGPALGEQPVSGGKKEKISGIQERELEEVRLELKRMRGK